MKRSHFFKSLLALAAAPLAVANSLDEPIAAALKLKESMEARPITSYVNGGIVRGYSRVPMEMLQDISHLESYIKSFS